MSGIIDTLQVVFTADAGQLTSQLAQISAQLMSLDQLAAQACAGLAALGSALDFGMGEAREDAFAAGSAVGAAFASGIRSAKNSVIAAAKALSAAAVTALNPVAAASAPDGGDGGTPAATAPDAIPAYAPAVYAAAFTPDMLAPAETAATRANAPGMNVVVPINLDGVKLGEACIKAMDMVSGMTGRTRLSI